MTKSPYYDCDNCQAYCPGIGHNISWESSMDCRITTFPEAITWAELLDLKL